MSLSYRVSRALCRLVLRLYFRWRHEGAENVPSEGPVILVSNHASFLDPPLVGCAFERPCHFLARESLFRSPLIGRYLRSLNAVPVDRDGGGGRGVKTILERLNRGGAIVIFPEGTRTPDGRLQAARSGIGLTVIQSQAAVVPVRVVGSYEAFGRSRRFPRPRPIRAIYGAPIDFSASRNEARSCDKPRRKAIYKETAARVMEEIDRLA